jgi:hypothetical protein
MGFGKTANVRSWGAEIQVRISCGNHAAGGAENFFYRLPGNIDGARLAGAFMSYDAASGALALLDIDVALAAAPTTYNIIVLDALVINAQTVDRVNDLGASLAANITKRVFNRDDNFRISMSGATHTATGVDVVLCFEPLG